jgi:hypothetical protein
MSQAQRRKPNGKQQQAQRRPATLELDDSDSDDMKCDRGSAARGFCAGCFSGALLLPLYIGAQRALYGEHQ